MKKYIAICGGLVVLNICLAKKSFGQHFIASDQDYRIVKFEKDIAQYLFKKDIVAKDTFNFEDYKYRVLILKCIEVYPDSLLLLRFIMGDDVPRYWGVLTNNEKYFFYDPDNLNEPDLARLRKKYSRSTIDPIVSYCYNKRYDWAMFTPMAIAVYEKKLAVIQNFLHTTDNFDLKKLDSAVFFLEKITGIKSQAHLNHRQRYCAVIEDYSKWLKWENINYKRLYWDRKTGLVTAK